MSRLTVTYFFMILGLSAGAVRAQNPSAVIRNAGAVPGRAVNLQEEIPQPANVIPAVPLTRRFGPVEDTADYISPVYHPAAEFEFTPVGYGFSYNRYYYRPYYAYRPYSYYGGYYASFYRPSFIYGYGYYGPAYPRYYNYGPAYGPGIYPGYGLPGNCPPSWVTPPTAPPSGPMPGYEGSYYY